MGTGDDVIINTIKGNKSMVLLPERPIYKHVTVWTKESDWFELAKDITFSELSEGGMSNLVFKIENRIAYEGV